MVDISEGGKGRYQISKGWDMAVKFIETHAAAAWDQILHNSSLDMPVVLAASLMPELKERFGL